MQAIPDIPGPDPITRIPSQTLPAGSCDTHAHLFGPADLYPYRPERSYTPPDALREDYVRLLRVLGFQRAVLVQPSVYGTDNRLLCDTLQRARDDPAGIAWRGVAVVDEMVTDAQLEAMRDLGVRGIRLNMLFRGGIDFSVARSLAQRIAGLGWHLQLLIDIGRVPDFASRLAELPVESVVDHMGHFDLAQGPSHPAFQSLLALLREGRTWVKLSGPNRISTSDSAPFPDVQAVARALIEARADRLVFGTDWPHVQLPTSMPNDGVLVDEFYRWIDRDERLAREILVENPARLYLF